MPMQDFLFRGSLRELDPEVFELAQIETERQYRKLIMIASESTAPGAVLEALGTRFDPTIHEAVGTAPASPRQRTTKGSPRYFSSRNARSGRTCMQLMQQ